MTTRVLRFDVFTSQPGKGNPAGVVLAADALEDSAMQRIAAATGCNDTAFVCHSRTADFRIRYFSPRREIELCGHATIAASLALQSRGLLAATVPPYRFSLETRAGILPIEVDADAAGATRVYMSQATSQFKAFDADRTLLMQSLGVSIADHHPMLPIVYGSTGRWTLIVPLRGLDAMRRLRPRPERFAEALVEIPGASVHPFCLEAIGAGVDLHARHFSSPGSGTVEDPVTGTASGVLGAYYREFIDRERDTSQGLVIEQGHEIGREGRVHVWAVRSASGYAVRIAGTACFVDEQSYT